MKRFYIFLIALMLLSIPAAASALMFSESSSRATGGSNDSEYNPGVFTSSSETVAPDAEARARTFSTGPSQVGGAGVQTLTRAPGTSARAQAGWVDTWTPIIGTRYDCGPPICPQGILATFSLDGVLDPLLVNPYAVEDGYSYMDFYLQYDFGNVFNYTLENRLTISADYDGGYGGGLRARLDLGINTSTYSTTDLSSFIVLGSANSNGDIPFSFDYNLGWFNTITLGEQLTMRAAIDQYYGTGSRNIDVYNTFTVSYTSLDPNTSWVSESGRTISAASVPVPEPSTLLLLGSGMAGLAMTGLRKFRKSA